MIDGYRITSDRSEMNIESIHNFISHSYWASGIPIETLKKAINNSLCFGVFSSQGLQVGFARMITDLSTYAYLADVYVLEEHRGKGLSKWLMREIMDHPDMQGLRRMGLATLDAHGLYKQYGFSELATPEIFMENWNPDVYKNA
ncbi:GNAT family N-acetyltransferase [Marinomonas posidonica]|uniref:GCN5-related N-acetyltransferase n=1 Tax=Marinomonas posidonica (strain CECT 7376 / NCIMB 14433 / IVIA-Po-181) TaxID=491952 RepID=F6CWN1_MARPP|nr:GNAT family N-acetyltransferase [Marinomonas posidonica]AEF54381.1 GCN5-related N-acetyltransferase [Marinomonas posidonica IVIA-Po-181]